MHTDTEYLKSIAKEIAGRQNEKRTHETTADPRLLAEIIRLEKAITAALHAFDNFPQRNTFHNDILGKLVDVCDILFEAQSIITPDVQLLLQTLTAIKQIIPGDISPYLRLPKAFILEQKQPTIEWWNNYLPLLQEQGINKKLIDIAEIPFKEFSEPKHKLYWGNFTWLKAYERKLEAMDWDNADCESKTEALVSLLIGSGFNDDRFVIYCKKIIAERAARKKRPA